MHVRYQFTQSAGKQNRRLSSFYREPWVDQHLAIGTRLPIVHEAPISRQYSTGVGLLRTQATVAFSISECAALCLYVCIDVLFCILDVGLF